MKVALVHDWLTGMRGGEQVLERIARRFPGAPIYTLVHRPGSISAALAARPIHTSFLQRLPDAARRYRWYLPLFPAAIESLDLSAYDVVVSTSHAVAKGVRTLPATFHLSYVHTPMRYIWELEHDYFGALRWPLSWYVRRVCAGLRRWDTRTAGRPAAILANSRHVADRIRLHWGREAKVVYPPVELERFPPAAGARDGYLLAGAFAPYKRGDLALRACQRLGRRLVVAGSGQQAEALRRLAGPQVEFRGWIPRDQLPALYGGVRALIFPGEEDFGIVPVEAMSSGCPVIAYGRGGLLETVGRGASPEALARVAQGGVERVPGGVLFGAQTVESLCAAIELFEHEPFEPTRLHAHAQPFSVEAFDRAFDSSFEAEHARWRAAGQR